MGKTEHIYKSEVASVIWSWNLHRNESLDNWCQMLMFFFIFADVIKIFFCPVIYTPVRWPKWWHHQLPWLFKNHRYCKFQLQHQYQTNLGPKPYHVILTCPVTFWWYLCNTTKNVENNVDPTFFSSRNTFWDSGSESVEKNVTQVSFIQDNFSHSIAVYQVEVNQPRKCTN